MAHILVVDDDPYIQDLIRMTLQSEGFHVTLAGDGEEALTKLEQQKIDLGIIDILMPKMDGYKLCQEIKDYLDIPIIMVTAKGETGDKVKGFRMGTDDYLVKPFEPLELIVRVHALLKRYKINHSQQIEIGNVTLFAANHEVMIDEEDIHLPPKEFEILFHFASHPNQTFTRRQLVEKFWGLEYEGDERTVDVHIKRLRERFAPLTESFSIVTVRGLGYKLTVNL
ncbi:response regulator transcription factor [Ammoniphilus sp. CFH 90114]|uniref:response regulator transcription factor n=1 Tax=Ammoniphilus sp. CFH 90114 TaxID=2493665 RepID=UPI00100FB49C|nr:response regulator transcription factor [Ammoniphilus sp. CFH 90114]RXT07033.1 response regulator transcription factor [Ammoniphilus sp. CFH 90114]